MTRTTGISPDHRPLEEVESGFPEGLRFRAWTLAGPLRFLRFLLIGLPVILSACAKTGEPQPPLVQLPRPSVDLGASQHGDGILLTASMPKENTDGSPAHTLREIELFRITEENRTASGQLPQDDFLARAERIFGIRDDFSPVLSGQRLQFRDSLRTVDRSTVYQRAFRYALRFINSKDQTAGLGNQVVIAPLPAPLPPADLAAEVTQEAIRLRWSAPPENSDGSRPARIAGYRLCRSEDPNVFPALPVHDGLLQKPETEDRNFQFDKAYYYAVSVVASVENPHAESQASSPLAVTPVDRFPPPAPANFQVVADKGVVILLWTAPEAPDIAGYRIYRSGGGEDRSLLQAELVSSLSFRDDKAAAGTPLRYGVTAVDTHGNEGPPAETTIEIPRQ